MKYKRSDIEEFEKRHDYNQILATKDPSSQEIQDSIEENSKEFLRQILERKQEQLNLLENKLLIQKIENKLNIVSQQFLQLTRKHIQVKKVLWLGIIKALAH
jgi:mannitol-1-phosphate/altronate dehydrogenase